MAKSNLNHLAGGLIQLVWLGLVLWAGYSLWFSVNRNVIANQKIEKFKSEIKNIQAQNEFLENLIAYQKTSDYKELEARRRLGLRAPGEKVIILPKSSPAPLGAEFGSINQNQKKASERPNYLKWYDFVIGWRSVDEQLE